VPEFDVVVIGSGPGGATAADVLTEAGRSVCILEKGRNHLLALDAPFDGLGHLSNDEVKFGRRHFLGPDPLLEPRSYRRSVADGERIAVGDVNNMPSTVGGAGFHADGKLPRYREVDFRLRSELGPVEGAAIADWPVDYAEMEPFYDEAERSIGVAGDHTGNPFAAWRSGPYPMPPGADMFLTTLTVPAAERHGRQALREIVDSGPVEYVLLVIRELDIGIVVPASHQHADVRSAPFVGMHQTESVTELVRDCAELWRASRPPRILAFDQLTLQAIDCRIAQPPSAVGA